MARDQAARDGQGIPDALGVRMPPPETVPAGRRLARLPREAKLKEAQPQRLGRGRKTRLSRAREGTGRRRAAKGIAARPRCSHRGLPVVQCAEKQLARDGAGRREGPEARKLEPPPLVRKSSWTRGSATQGLPAGRATCSRRPCPMPGRREAAGLRDGGGAGGSGRHPELSFARADFTGADFLRAGPARAWTFARRMAGERRLSANANLSGATFQSAVLAHAKLDGATAIGASFPARPTSASARLARRKPDGCRFRRRDAHALQLRRHAGPARQLHQGPICSKARGARPTGAGALTWRCRSLTSSTCKGMRWPGRATSRPATSSNASRRAWTCADAALHSHHLRHLQAWTALG